MGRACASLLARKGARVTIAARRQDRLDAVAREISSAGGVALALRCDVTQRASVEQANRETVGRFGRLDIVVNSAGALLVAAADATSDEDWDPILAVNLRGAFLVSRAALPELRRAGGGSIVSIGSVLGLVGMKERAAYAASKGE